jgi:peptidoglycan glycosyltransferase
MMGRRIRWVGLVLVLCFAALLVQLVNVQFRRASALANSRTNPKVEIRKFNNQRGDILAADGTLLAQSVPASQGPYHYMRQYPLGSLFSGIVGYSSLFYGTRGVESVYNNYLVPHPQPPPSHGQVLNPPPAKPDNVTLTLVPSLQQTAAQALANIPDANKDGAIVALNPSTGAVLAMYSSPSFDPNALASPNVNYEELAGNADFNVKDAEGFYPGDPMATFYPLAPGSTFKVVTTTSVYNLKPQLSNFTFPVMGCTPPNSIPGTNISICNDANTPQQATPCGGTIPQMLPPSCDPGYALLGVALGGDTLYQQANLFGFNSVPPIDLTNVQPSNFPTPAQLAPGGSLGQGGAALSAFGQQDVTATALQMSMVAAGIANNGVVMTPHVMSEIRNGQGGLVKAYPPHPYKTAATVAAAQQVNGLMQAVATAPDATAAGIFPPALNVAVKTGTAQTLNNATNDWMIGFAPASAPKVAVAVLVPYQANSSSGASIAGPIMLTMLQAALALPGA